MIDFSLIFLDVIRSSVSSVQAADSSEDSYRGLPAASPERAPYLPDVPVSPSDDDDEGRRAGEPVRIS